MANRCQRPVGFDIGLNLVAVLLESARRPLILLAEPHPAQRVRAWKAEANVPINVMLMDGIGSARMGERQGEPLMVNFELFRWIGYMQVILFPSQV